VLLLIQYESQVSIQMHITGILCSKCLPKSKKHLQYGFCQHDNEQSISQEQWVYWRHGHILVTYMMELLLLLLLLLQSCSSLSSHEGARAAGAARGSRPIAAPPRPDRHFAPEGWVPCRLLTLRTNLSLTPMFSCPSCSGPMYCVPSRPQLDIVCIKCTGRLVEPQRFPMQNFTSKVIII
jgi:hypothetical protein